MELALLGIRRESDQQKDRSSNMGTRCMGPVSMVVFSFQSCLEIAGKKKSKEEIQRKTYLKKKKGEQMGKA